MIIGKFFFYCLHLNSLLFAVFSCDAVSHGPVVQLWDKQVYVTLGNELSANDKAERERYSE